MYLSNASGSHFLATVFDALTFSRLLYMPFPHGVRVNSFLRPNRAFKYGFVVD